MVPTFQALAVVTLAVLPGALYTWGVEREDVPTYGHPSDRIFRFLGVSALWLLPAAPVIYWAYRRFVVPGVLADGRALPGWTWLVAVAYFALPTAAGSLVGWSTRHGLGWVRPLVGPAPAPRGWDQLFRTPGLAGYVRVRLLDGGWLLGVWSVSPPGSGLPGSYAAGFPHDQDLYFVDTCEIGDDGDPVLDPVEPL